MSVLKRESQNPSGSGRGEVTNEKKVDSCYRVFWNWSHQGACWGERHRWTYGQGPRSLEAAAPQQSLPATPSPTQATALLLTGSGEGPVMVHTRWAGQRPGHLHGGGGPDACQNTDRQAHPGQVDKQKLPDQSRFRALSTKSIIY